MRKLVRSDASSSLPHTPQKFGNSKPRSTAYMLRLSVIQYHAVSSSQADLSKIHGLAVSYPFLSKSSAYNVKTLFTEQPQHALLYKL